MPNNGQLFSLFCAQQDVREFHKKFGAKVQDYPGLIPGDLASARDRFHREEVDELDVAMIEENLADIADAIGDAIYFLLGTAVCYGIDMEPVWQEIHKKNMEKVGGGKRADGKHLKPEGWTPPDIKSIIDKQIAEGKKK